ASLPLTSFAQYSRTKSGTPFISVPRHSRVTSPFFPASSWKRSQPFSSSSRSSPPPSTSATLRVLSQASALVWSLRSALWSLDRSPALLSTLLAPSAQPSLPITGSIRAFTGSDRSLAAFSPALSTYPSSTANLRASACRQLRFVPPGFGPANRRRCSFFASHRPQDR